MGGSSHTHSLGEGDALISLVGPIPTRVWASAPSLEAEYSPIGPSDPQSDLGRRREREKHVQPGSIPGVATMATLLVQA